MTDRDDIIRDLAGLLMAALDGPQDDAYDHADRITSALGLGEDDTPEMAEAELRKALGALAPGADELAAAIRDTPILVENYGYDDSVGAFTATAMLPDELASVLLDKAWDEAATAAGEEPK